MEEVTDSVKRSDLLRYGIDYGREKIYDTGPGLVGYKKWLFTKVKLQPVKFVKLQTRTITALKSSNRNTTSQKAVNFHK